MARTSLRERLEDGPILQAVGAHDGLTAHLAQRAGMEAVYQGGYAVAAHHHGLPDIGLLGLAEIARATRAISAAADIPVLVDADTGFGALAAVRRTVRELERAGAAAIQIEDQQFPKRCGHMEGKRVIDPDEMVLKIRAAVDERRDPETVIIGRTDALQVTDLDDVIDRCNRYREAGADVTFVDAPRTVEEMAEIARRVDGPVMVNMSETGRSPVLSAAELEKLGYALVVYPTSQTWLFSQIYLELCEELKAKGTTKGMADRMFGFDEFNASLGVDTWERLPAVR